MLEDPMTTGTGLSRVLRALSARRVQPHLWKRARGWRALVLAGRSPVLVLTTTNRHSGKAQSTVLVYLSYGEGYALAATSLNANHEPGWCLNLRAGALARVETAGQRMVVRAREASGQEALRLRARFVEQLHQADSTLARRHIPMMVLEPLRCL